MMDKREFVYATAANGLMVRVPKDKLAAWQRAQAALTPEQIEEDRRTLAQVRSKLTGR